MLEPLTREPAAILRPSWEREQQLQYLERCLGELPPENRQLIEAYYQEEKRVKIDQRLRLAQQLGLSPNALRLRVHQIRLKLEVRMCKYLDCPLQGRWCINPQSGIPGR